MRSPVLIPSQWTSVQSPNSQEEAQPKIANDQYLVMFWMSFTEPGTITMRAGGLVAKRREYKVE